MPDQDGPPADLARRLASQELARQVLGTVPAGEMRVSDASRSMAPLLEGGETVHWQRPSRPPRLGDLLVFVQPPGPVVHRVMARGKKGIIWTKGDGRPEFDRTPVQPQEILGVVVALERGGEVRRLTGAKPRFYAAVVWCCSIFGAAVHWCAAAGDAVLRRLSPDTWGDRRLLRAPAWWLQRRTQELIHALLFKFCHPVREDR
jgi:hypothetical protein